MKCEDTSVMLSIKPIAYIHSDFSEKFGIPRQSGLVDSLQAKIIFTEEFRNGDCILVCIPSSRQLKKYKIFVLPGWISGNIFMPPIVAFHEIPLVLRLQVLSVAGRLYSNLYIL